MLCKCGTGLLYREKEFQSMGKNFSPMGRDSHLFGWDTGLLNFPRLVLYVKHFVIKCVMKFPLLLQVLQVLVNVHIEMYT